MDQARMPKHFPFSALTTALLLAGLAPQVVAASNDTHLDTVTVISTGIRGQERTVADSPAPIDVINSCLLYTSPSPRD